MPLIHSIISWLNTKRLYQMELYRNHPHEMQRETFIRLIEKAQDTEWGRKFHYGDLQTEKEFRDRIPLQHYEGLEPYVERLRMGDKDILWPGEIRWFAKSSGTTASKSKFIPVSKEALEECHFRGGRDMLALYLRNNPESNLMLGKSLTLGGSHRVNNFSNNSYYGDLSAILIENIPYWTEFYRTPSTEIALIEEFEEKVEKIIEASLEANVTSFAGVPSWYLVLLKKVLETTGKSNILEVWPNLELFIHGGVNFEPYRAQYRKLIPSEKMHYMEAYNASEGFFAIQDNPHRNDMLLMLDYGVYYEFIPMSEYGSDNPRVVPLSEVETGVNYALVISTNSGLWRYIIGDTVEFTCQYPYKIRITGRTKHFINAFGEEVIIDNAEKALKVACAQTGAVIHEYTAGPVFMGDNQKGAHQWIIEFDKEPDDLDHFILSLDNTLKTVNSDYEAKRHRNITLEMPHVTAAPQGTFYKWMKERGKIGGQNKIPRLSNNRNYLEEILRLIQKKQ